MDGTQSFRIFGTSDIKNIDVDIVNGQNVIYWEDIEQVFPKVGHICNCSSVVKLVRDSNRTRQREISGKWSGLFSIEGFIMIEV